MCSEFLTRSVSPFAITVIGKEFFPLWSLALCAVDFTGYGDRQRRIYRHEAHETPWYGEKRGYGDVTHHWAQEERRLCERAQAENFGGVAAYACLSIFQSPIISSQVRKGMGMGIFLYPLPAGPYYYRPHCWHWTRENWEDGSQKEGVESCCDAGAKERRKIKRVPSCPLS